MFYTIKIIDTQLSELLVYNLKFLLCLFYFCLYLVTDHLTEVYDVTVAYPDILPSPEINLIYGHIPHEVHYLVRRFNLSDLLDITNDNRKLDEETNDKLSKWLQNRWLEKENILKEYYGWFTL